MRRLKLSAIRPCTGGTKAPPKIAITNKEDPVEVKSPNPFIAEVKITGHITELNKPTATMVNSAKLPSVNTPSNKSKKELKEK